MIVRTFIALMVAWCAGDAAYAQVAADPALSVAQVYLGQPVFAATIQKESHLKVAFCVRTGQIDGVRAKHINETIDRYQAQLDKFLPDMQSSFADLIRPKFTALEMQEIARFITSSAGRSFVFNLAAATAERMLNTAKFCAAPAPPGEKQAIFREAIAKLSPADRVAFGAFAQRPVASKVSVLSQAVGFVRGQFQPQFDSAGTKSGFTASLIQ